MLVATAGEEVITLNVGHLGDAQGLIISLNASGFPMFSPYTHCWPMTHQPVYPHSKPLLHYLNRQASCWKVGGQTPGSSSFIISPSSHKRRTHNLNRVHSSKMPHILWILPARRTKRNRILLFRFTGLVAVFAAVAVWQSTELLEDLRHSIEIVSGVTLSGNWYVSAHSCIINCFRWCKRECSLLQWATWPTVSEAPDTKKNS